MKGFWKLIWRFVKLFVILFITISVLWVIVYRFVNPPVTWLMLTRGFEQKAAGKPWKIDKQWRDFDDIADPMKRAAVAAEDQTFLDHFGFDFKAMERARYQKPSRVWGGMRRRPRESCSLNALAEMAASRHPPGPT